MSHRLGLAYICRMLLLLSSMLLIVCTTSLSQEGRYLPDFVGKVKISVDARDPAQYNLSQAETRVVRQNLERLRDLLIAQPTLNPPRGIEVDGDIIIDWTSLCPDPPCPKVPVVFSGRFRFLEYFEVNSKPVHQDEAEAVMGITTNDPNAGLLSLTYEGVKDLEGHKVGFQLPKIGELGAYSLYRNGLKNMDMLVLTKSPKPYWVPFTQEAFLLLRIRETEEQLAKMTKQREMDRDPAGDEYRKWVAEKPQRDKDAQEVYEAVKKTDPQKAKNYLEDREKNELIMTEGLRKNMEQNPPQQGPTQSELDWAHRLARHKEVLAAMTPAERQAQVRYFPSRDAIEPDIVPMDSEVGNPLVIANPDFIDPALPRTAIQVITVSFNYGGNFDPASNEYNESNANPANLRLRDMEQKSDWRAISSILSVR